MHSTTNNFKAPIRNPEASNVILLISGRASMATSLLSCSPYPKKAVENSPIASLGCFLSAVPASQASVERVFSAADFQADGRCRLSFEHLAREVYIRVNHLALGAQ